LDKKIQLDYLYPKRSFSKLPKFFSKEEVRNILDNTQNLKHKAILLTIYSCGLRLSELLNLNIKDIKSSDGIIRIHQSKGNKDRIVSLPDKLLATLRHYYQAFKPKEYLFFAPSLTQVNLVRLGAKKKSSCESKSFLPGRGGRIGACSVLSWVGVVTTKTKAYRPKDDRLFLDQYQKLWSSRIFKHIYLLV
jgi:integrase